MRKKVKVSDDTIIQNKDRNVLPRLVNICLLYTSPSPRDP